LPKREENAPDDNQMGKAARISPKPLLKIYGRLSLVDVECGYEDEDQLRLRESITAKGKVMSKEGKVTTPDSP